MDIYILKKGGWLQLIALLYQDFKPKYRRATNPY